MKRIFKSQFWAMLLVAAMTVGCTESPIDEVGGVDAPSAEPIEVSLSLSVEPLSAGTLEAAENGTLTESRSVDSDGTEISEEINNLWIIQFSGTSDESVVVGSPTYFEPYDPATSIVTLIPSTENNTIVYLANTFKTSIGVVAGTTMEDFKDIMTTISSEEGCFTTDSSDNKYMLMNGYQEETIDSETSLTCALKRNIAKISVTIENASDGALDITSLQMCGVGAKIPYFAEQVTRDSETLETPFPANSSIINYDIETLTFDGENKATITFYVPCNMRGVVANSNAESSKPAVAPSASTFLSVFGEAADNAAYAYNFYLGENMTNDFNIKPNCHYSYTFTFNGVGDPTVDNRIESLGEIDYRQRESSNCYILNPATSYERSYLIPIEDRISTFWNDYTTTSCGAITSGSWDVEVLWYDCDRDPISTDANATLTNEQVRIVAYSEALQPEAIKVTLGQNFNNDGNIVVAVKKDGAILWSWHFWITDYNPDSVDYGVDSDQYVYDVANGEIHRYGGTYWEVGNLYGDTFIMDRNVGARDTELAASYGAGSIYYQFGRKDPFPGSSGKFQGSYGSSTTAPIYSSSSTTGNGVSFATAVQNPTTYYAVSSTVSNWCNETTSAVTSYLWNDKNTSNSSISSTYGDKSIFDPSPLGWKLPMYTVHSDFSTTTSTWVDSHGRLYGGYAFYPAAGYRAYSIGTNGGIGTYGRYWRASASSSVYAYMLYIYNTNCNPSHAYIRAEGYPVRCVKE